MIDPQVARFRDARRRLDEAHVAHAEAVDELQAATRELTTAAAALAERVAMHHPATTAEEAPCLIP